MANLLLRLLHLIGGLPLLNFGLLSSARGLNSKTVQWFNQVQSKKCREDETILISDSMLSVTKKILIPAVRDLERLEIRAPACAPLCDSASNRLIGLSP